MAEPALKAVATAGPAPLTLKVVGDLSTELHPRDAPTVTLDSRLQEDLGLDSLSRAELLLRLEHAFGVSLPEQALLSADTPRDLVLLVERAAPARSASQRERKQLAAGSGTQPREAHTLVDVLLWHAAAHPHQLHVHLYGEADRVEDVSYETLRAGAERIAAGLAAHGLQPGDTVATMLPTGSDYLLSFFGVLVAGGVPVPLYPPARLTQIEDHLQRHLGILASSRARMLITVREGKPLSLLLRARAESLRAVVTVADLSAGAGALQPVARQPSDLALLQYTSGSTGNPKGVALTHANLLANIRTFGPALRLRADDVFVSWLPLYHDMGLIGAWLGSLYYGVPLALMSPLAFLAHPARWLWTIHRHRGTLSAAPNFAYELCARRVPADDLEGLDLSSWRAAMNGSEPVSADTLDAFARRFAAYGLRREALMPVYGLAECAVALTFPPLERGPLVDVIDREALMREGRAVPVPAQAAQALRLVSSGRPLPGHEVRVVDAAGREVADRAEGALEFRGPSTTAGYYRDPEQTRALFDGDWLASGDRAYVADGEIYITGRSKDVIIRGGRNIHPYDLEIAVGNIAGIRKGCVAVFGSTDPHTRTERLVVLAETNETDAARRERLVQQIQTAALDLLGMPADDVVLAPPRTVLKTSSGKIRRAASRAFYERKGAGARPSPMTIQLARLLASALVPEAQRILRSVGAVLYAAFAWAMLFLIAAPVWIVVATAQRPRLARSVCHRAARLLAALTRIRVRVTGVENLPGAAHVVAANHSSYVDAIVLAAALPPEHPYVFVAKREFEQRRIPRWFLRGLGAILVERIDPERGVADTAGAQRAAEGGASLIFFPEGTFDRKPGLRRFHLGAFLVAARSALPVVPIGIRGTRSILRERSWFPRPGAVAVSIGPPIAPVGRDWAAAGKLRDAVRTHITRLSGEPERLE